MTSTSHKPRHFLDLHLHSTEELRFILDSARTYKRAHKAGERQTHLLPGKHLAMLFEKPSTRTRVSFEVGIRQLGGDAVVLDQNGSQLGRGETIPDTARVLSRYVDLIMLRCFEHEKLTTLAEYASVPVINGLTDASHPCQIMADILTIEEHRGPIEGKVIAWVGDGYNMLHSFIHAAVKLDFVLRMACPPACQPDLALVAWAIEQGAQIQLVKTPQEAVKDADAVLTDTWTSMGMEGLNERLAHFEGYQINDALMALAKKDALFLHCLPAHRGEEVTDSVMDGPQSVVFDEAENRLHVQKAIMLWCMGVM